MKYRMQKVLKKLEEGHSIFTTGSDSYLLSGELMTKLTVRYIETEMFTLTFYEYLEMKKFMRKMISQNIVRQTADDYFYI